MAKDTRAKQVELILNESTDDHSEILKSLLRSARRFLCMTAFAKKTGLKLIRKELKECLDAGLEARFVIGLNFYQTDPAVLEELLAFGKRYSLELLVSRPPWRYQDMLDDAAPPDNAAWNFHPKVFLFEHAGGTSALIGSANVTGGGLVDNHEASILIRDGSEVIIERIAQQLEQLVMDKQVVPADVGIIREYARRHAIYKVYNALAERRAKRVSEQSEGLNLDMLKSILAEMKADMTEKGFEANRTHRSTARNKAREVVTLISNSPPLSERHFLKLYEELVSGLWHSGGLQRGKNRVAKHAHAFQDAIQSLGALESLSVEDAFDILHRKMLGVSGAGINVITEILHSLDNFRFVVMNQNSVSGLEVAGVHEFPKRPNKEDVNAATYANFCSRAADVRDGLHLKNFTELDALFNYAYWDHKGQLG